MLADDARAVRAVMTIDGVGRFESGRRRGRRAGADAADRRQGRERRDARSSPSSPPRTTRDCVKRVTGTQAVVTTGSGMAAATLADAGAERLPVRGEVEIGGRTCG